MTSFHPLQSAAATRPGRTWYRCAQHRRQPSDLRASPRNSQEDLDKARQRLIASSGYDELVNRVEGNSPFVEPGAAGGVEEAGGEAPGLVFVRQVVRVAVDVAIVLVPVVLVVHFVKLPPAVVDALGSAAAAIKASSLEPVRTRGRRTSRSKGDVVSQRMVFLMLACTFESIARSQSRRKDDTVAL